MRGEDGGRLATGLACKGKDRNSRSEQANCIGFPTDRNDNRPAVRFLTPLTILGPRGWATARNRSMRLVAGCRRSRSQNRLNAHRMCQHRRTATRRANGVRQDASLWIAQHRLGSCNTSHPGRELARAGGTLFSPLGRDRSCSRRISCAWISAVSAVLRPDPRQLRQRPLSVGVPTKHAPSGDEPHGDDANTITGKTFAGSLDSNADRRRWQLLRFVVSSIRPLRIGGR